MNITLAGTKVSMDGHTLAFQKNNLVDSMVITVDTDETWQYKLDVKYPCKDSNGKELYNVIDLTRVGNTCTAILQATMLPFNGKYTMQLRGVSGDKVYHTDTFDVWVKYSIDPGKVYDPVPSEFYQIEQAVTEQAANAKQSATESAESATNAAASATKAENAVVHSPIVGENGNWLIWDFEKSEYVDSGTSASGTPPITPDTAGKYLTNDGSKAEWGVISGGSDPSLGITGATVGQIAKITAVDDTGKPTAWEAADMPSGGGPSGGGHWETVLDTVWEQDVIKPTAFDSETGIFTCAEGELNNLELNKEYAFFQQCTKEGIAYNTILGNENLKLTKLSDTTFSIDVTPPATFVPTNVKFSKGACLAVTDIDAKKIRLTLDGQFKPTATMYDRPFYGVEKPYFGRNTGYIQIRNAYQAYQQVTAEVESPYRIVGEILCGFNAPGQNGNFHFKNNSFCCPLVPYDVPQGHERNYFLTSDGTKIAKLYSTYIPWHLGGSNENTAIINDSLTIISGTKVKLERWVE